ncbi:hypothetical protein SLS59_000508 [Nothophoma quercina]|uniref:Uncharacterized protein n=1 Tax=Nothophoma quercina TaxID=749835 RepID=A0ABR3S2G6_9PLEO
MDEDLPVLIIGAGISGLLLAQQLRQLNMPFKIFERDDDFSSRGSGWGLTLHWSLLALRELLPEYLLARLRDTYVDRAAVERGEDSMFPFFDLTTGDRKVSVLQAPQSPQDGDEDFVYQVCISGSTDKEPFCTIANGTDRATNDERLTVIRNTAQDFAEPFRSFLSLVPDDANVKQLDLDDWAFPNNSSATGSITLVGDAAHAMTKFLGAGANHAIVDVLELKQMVLSKLPSATRLRLNIQKYQQSMADRTLPTVLASRQACLEAHDWANLTSKSHLLSARQMVIDFDVDIRRLRRKVDWRIVPLMFGCYTMQFLDKVILNYAAVMGIQKDLHLVGNDFSNIATFLFVGLLCFEVPNIYLLQMVPAAKWLGLNVILWGIAVASGAAATSYRTLLISRVFLGIFEATIGPSLLLISSQWYSKSEQAPRFSFWYCGLGFGQIIGGAISYGFQHVVPGQGSLGGESSTLIRNLGYKPKQAALMNMPSGVFSIFFTIFVGIGIRKRSNRWLWIICCIIPAILGGALMFFLPVFNRRGCLAGIYLVNAVVAPLPVLYAWTAANVSGSNKRAFAAAIVSRSFSIGNIIGPQTFQARDAPDYRPAKIAVMGTQAGCALVTAVLYVYYRWQNIRQDRKTGEVKTGEEAFMSKEAWNTGTDRQDSDFRYSY